MRISGAGCCLVDSIHMHCSYESNDFSPYWSKAKGDGGLIEGGLVVSEDLERFANKSIDEILKELTRDRISDIRNVGGPAIIALVHAAQVLSADSVEVAFYGALGNDELKDVICSKLSLTQVRTHLKILENVPTSTTEVFDDPTRRNGKGERTFITNVGSAGYFKANDLPKEFYDSDLILLGGTALVPKLHQEIDIVLKRAKEKGAITVVGTVYDFINEKAHPDKPWPLGKTPSYQYIDILVTDEEESLRLSGEHEVFKAAAKLASYGVGLLVITRGAKDILISSDGSLFKQQELTSFPVSRYIDDLMAQEPLLRKDTTGCGDNFVGGVLVSVIKQLEAKKKGELDLVDLCAWGACSGGFTCTYHGGMYHEKDAGEKASCLKEALLAYKKDLEGST